jgi:hypothetical protein
MKLFHQKKLESLPNYKIFELLMDLYYKERRQLKTFLTQFRRVLPLTPDPPVRLDDDQKGGTTIEIAIWGAFLPKTNCFSHPPRTYPPRVPALGPPARVPAQPHVTQRTPTPPSFLFLTLFAKDFHK